jgi:ribosomal protein L39E
MDLNMAKKTSVTYRNPVAKAMLQERRAPQVVPPKKGGKAKHNRKQEKVNAIRDAKLCKDD